MTSRPKGKKAEAAQCVRAGIAALEKRDLKTAEKHLWQAIKLDPKCAEAYLQLGILTKAHTPFLQRACGMLSRALEFDDSLSDAYMHWAIALAHLGEDDRAEEKFREFIERSDDVSLAYAVYADFLMCRDRDDEAESAFKRALEENPDNAIALRDYARLLATVGRTKEAERMFRTVYQMDPDDQWTNHRYGAFLAILGGRDGLAETMLRRAVQLDPSYEDAVADLDDFLHRRSGSRE